MPRPSQLLTMILILAGGCSSSPPGATDTAPRPEARIPDAGRPDRPLDRRADAPADLRADHAADGPADLAADQAADLAPDQAADQTAFDGTAEAGVDLTAADLFAVEMLAPDLKYVPPSPPPGCNQPSPIVASCVGGFCTIPAGCFLMGSPLDATCRDSDEVHHWVILTRSFEISSTEVTQAQFQSLMAFNPTQFPTCGGTCPVDSVTWHQAAAYANALSASKSLTACYACTGAGATLACTVVSTYRTAGKTIHDCPGYRLPTEAEWEYAYRAGTTTDLYNGVLTSCWGQDPMADAIGWYGDNAPGGPSPVAGKLVNSWGLYDMGGNLEEWVHGGYAPYGNLAVTDPVLPTAGPDFYMGRGGQWGANPTDLRAADRNAKTATDTESDMGFRVVRSL